MKRVCRLLDALHIAIATAHRIEYLLTWNCMHIANAVMRSGIEQACRDFGFAPPNEWNRGTPWNGTKH
ncbi:MAG TPA: hypothetical protein DCG57_00185 [Candidatus Riflebacteria bacterium]|nr:hypothetical protein [Candidatus Riflebacteria bacterium]